LDKLQRKYDKVKRDLRQRDEECKAKEAHIHDMELRASQEIKRAVIQRDLDWDKTWKDKNNHLIRDLEDARQQRHQLEKTISLRETEIRELEGQIKRLKHDISLSTRSEPQKTDDLFNQDLGDLWRNLQSWIWANFKAKIGEFKLVLMS